MWRLISVATLASLRVRKWSRPIQSLIVPKTCSTMLRRTRMALGISSRRRCMASITASCSQRVMRRCLLGVHMVFIAQAAVTGPVSAERQPVLDSGVAPDQLFAGRAAVGVGFGLINEVLLSEAPVGLCT